MNNKTKAILISLSLAGSAFVGSEANRPECDFILMNEQEEICLSQEQAEVFIEHLKSPVGFGGTKFSGVEEIIKKND